MIKPIRSFYIHNMDAKDSLDRIIYEETLLPLDMKISDLIYFPIKRKLNGIGDPLLIETKKHR